MFEATHRRAMGPGGMKRDAKKGREAPALFCICVGRNAAYLFGVLIAKRFFSGFSTCTSLALAVRTFCFHSAPPLGDGRGQHWEGRGSGDAHALTCFQAATFKADGVKDAVPAGARTAPPDARAGLAVSVTVEPPD